MSVPAVTVMALVEALETLGAPAAALRERLPDGEVDVEPGRRLPQSVWRGLIDVARDNVARPTLALEAGMAVPYGGFGVVDYLVGSSVDVRASMLALQSNFPALATGVGCELDERADGATWVGFLATGAAAEWDLEFSLGVLVSRLRHVAGHVDVFDHASLRRSGDDQRFTTCLDMPVTFAGQHVGALITANAMEAQLRTSDARLHQALGRVAKSLGVGNNEPPLELAVRARLRDLLPLGRSDAQSVARSLGVSERTLARRLAKHRRTFRQILDAFRAHESERLLLGGDHSFAQISSRLGYSDQSAWTKAFQRWRGCTPGAWLRDARG